MQFSRKLVLGYCAVLACASALAAMVPSMPVSAQEFYKDKKINLIVPTGPGGSFAAYSRLLAQFMPKYIAGKPDMIVQFKPGAGGVVAAKYMAAVAPKDATVIAALHSASIHAPMLRGVDFDPSTFGWIGSITPMWGIVSVLRTAPATTLEQIKKTPVQMAASSADNETSLIPLIMNNVLGTKFNVVLGYRGGGAMFHAMEQGEAQGRVASWDSYLSGRPDWIKQNKLVHLVQYGPKNSALKDVPDLKDLLKEKRDREMIEVIEIGMQLGRAFFAPPGIPEARLNELRKAFNATMEDGAFKHQAARQGLGVEPRKGEDLAKMVKAAYQTPSETIAYIKSFIGKKGGGKGKK